MLTTALILFALGAVGGLTMALLSFKNRAIPWLLTIGHGLLVASGLVLLLITVLEGVGGGTAKIALGILLAAALAGFYLLRFHIKKETHPQGGIILHALIAVIGVACLIAAVTGAGS